MSEYDPAEPPNDLDAERAVLGAMLLSRDAIDAVLDVMEGKHFYRPAHEMIFNTAVDLYSAGTAVDGITAAAELARRGELGKVGGPPYLHTLMASTPSAGNAVYYAAIVREKAQLRGVSEALLGGQQLLRAGEITADEVADEVVNRVTAARGTVRRAESNMDIYGRVLEHAESDTETLPGFDYGWYDVDAAMLPQRPGQFILVGGRPGMGKSVFLTNSAKHVAWQQTGTSLLVSMEMTAEEVWARLLADHAKVALNKLLRLGGARMTEDDWRKIADAQELPAAVNDDDRSRLNVVYEPGATLADVRSMVRAYKPNCVYLDYLQLMTPPAAESRQQEVSLIARGCKLLAQREEVSLMAATQLSRAPGQRTDRRPQLTDLRESGSLEQEADAVILLHREDYYDRESTRPGEADFIIAKQRGGPSGFTITTAFQGHYARFADMASEQEPAPAIVR